MKKLIGFVFAILLLIIGILGIYHFYKLENARNLLNSTIDVYRKGRREEAITALNKIAGDYNYPVVKGYVYLLLGDIYYDAENIKKSIEYYNQITKDLGMKEIKKVYYQAHVRIAGIYLKLLKSKKIEDKNELILKKIYELESLIKENEKPLRSHPVNLKNILYYFESIAFKPEIYIPDIDESIDQLKTELGYLYFYAGNTKKAEDYFKEVDNTYAKLGLARIYLLTGRRERALELLYDIKEFVPDKAPIELYYDELFRYANDLFKKAFYEEAIFYFKKISLKMPDTLYSELSLYKLANYYYDRNEYKPALKYINSLISNSIYAKDQNGFILKGIIMYKTGNYNEALQIFNNFLKRYPSSRRKSEVREWKALCERSIKYLN